MRIVLSHKSPEERRSSSLIRRSTVSNKQTNEWEAAEVADIKVFVTELDSCYSKASEVSSSDRTNSITSSLPSTRDSPRAENRCCRSRDVSQILCEVS